jgi:hypothetical protein
MLIVTRRTLIFVGLSCLVTGCAKEIPPRTVSEFVDNPILLEATMVRCAQNRSQTKYDPECVNAREAVNRIATIQDQARREELETQSEQKRQALRRTQEAAAEARRRVAEAQRRREEAAYLGQFDAPAQELTPGAASDVPNEGARPSLPEERPGPVVPQSDSKPTDAAATDLEAIRDELKRRQDDPQ